MSPLEDPLFTVFGLMCAPPARGSMYFSEAHVLRKMIDYVPKAQKGEKNRYLGLDIWMSLEYNICCVPKTAGGESRKSCRGELIDFDLHDPPRLCAKGRFSFS